MERISWFIEDLRDEQEKQRIIPAPYTIRNRVEGTMDKLEYDIARLRYGAAYHSGEFNIDRISPDVWDDMKMAESDMLLIFADIMWDVQWLVRFFGILKGKNIKGPDDFDYDVSPEQKSIILMSFSEKRIRKAASLLRMPNYTSDLLCPVIMDYNVDFPDMMGLFKKCFGELWKAGLEDIPGSISAQYYKKLPEDYYVLPYGMRDTLKKRREIMKKIEAFLDSIPRKNLQPRGKENAWFTVVCYGSFRTSRYQETSDIDLLIIADSFTTELAVQSRLAQFLEKEGLFHELPVTRLEHTSPFALQALLTSTWLYEDEVLNRLCFGEWVKRLVDRWGYDPMDKLRQEQREKTRILKEKTRNLMEPDMQEAV